MKAVQRTFAYWTVHITLKRGNESRQRTYHVQALLQGEAVAIGVSLAIRESDPGVYLLAHAHAFGPFHVPYWSREGDEG